MSNPNIRCPLPPVGADPDSLRQFEGTDSPHFRVIPLSIQTGGAVTVNEGGAVAGASGGGGSSGTSPTAIVSKSVAISLTSLPSGAAINTFAAMSQSFQLLSIGASQGVCVRLYGTRAAQTADAVRPIDAPPAAETIANLILDVVLDTAPFLWQTQNIIGANQDAPQSTTIYVTVINPATAGLGVTTVTLTFVPLES